MSPSVSCTSPALGEFSYAAFVVCKHPSNGSLGGNSYVRMAAASFAFACVCLHTCTVYMYVCTSVVCWYVSVHVCSLVLCV